MAVRAFTFFLLIALNGGLGTVSGELLSPGPNTYTISEGSLGTTNVWMHHEHESLKSADPNLARTEPETEIQPPVLASDFAIGELTPLSLFDTGVMFNYSGNPNDELSVTLATVGSENSTYTFIEAFDVSADGKSGGFVQLVEGGIGHNHFLIKMTSFGFGVRMHIVAYAEDKINGGQNFRLGRYGPGLSLWEYRFVELDGIENDVVSYELDYQAPGDIVFIQGTDYVARGTGGLVGIVGGEVGTRNITLSLVSGIGEELRFVVAFYVATNQIDRNHL